MSRRDLRGVRVLVVGTFDPAFARNRILVGALERAGATLDLRPVPLWGRRGDAVVQEGKLRLAGRALRAIPLVGWRFLRAPRPDVVVVAYPGHLDMWIVGLLAKLRGVPVVFDVFISLFDTIVSDRRLRSPTSAFGRAAAIVDRVACRLADVVLADTPPHADFFARHTGVPRDRFAVWWIGAQGDLFHPVAGVEPVERRVLFHGTFIRLQGLETIVRAAKRLEPDGVTVRILGDGQERPTVERLLAELEVGNVELVGMVPLEQVPREIAAAALCLGIFGTSDKAARVVPNKLYECLAVGRPVVTADTPAIRSAFDGEVATSAPGDPEALASTVRDLLADPARRERLAREGRARYERDYAEAALASLLATHLTDAIARHRRRGRARADTGAEAGVR